MTSPHRARPNHRTVCLEDGLEPACAKSCPTDSIQFGPHEELVEIASRWPSWTSAASTAPTCTAPVATPTISSPGGLGAFFLLSEPPERYGLPANADSPVQENAVPSTVAAVGGGLLAGAGAVAAFLVAARRARDDPAGGAW